MILYFFIRLMFLDLLHLIVTTHLAGSDVVEFAANQLLADRRHAVIIERSLKIVIIMMYNT